MAYGRQLERWSNADNWQGTLPLTIGRVKNLQKFSDISKESPNFTQVLCEYGESDPWSSLADDELGDFATSEFEEQEPHYTNTAALRSSAGRPLFN